MALSNRSVATLCSRYICLEIIETCKRLSGNWSYPYFENITYLTQIRSIFWVPQLVKAGDIVDFCDEPNNSERGMSGLMMNFLVSFG